MLKSSILGLGERASPSSNTLADLFSPIKFWRRALLLVWEASPKFTVYWAILWFFREFSPVIITYLTKYVIDGS